MTDRFAVIVVVAVVTWTVVFVLLGGKFVRQYPFITPGWGQAWRSLLAGFAAALAAAGALELMRSPVSVP
jgi:membrane protein DedA with SNARE-associated domain